MPAAVAPTSVTELMAGLSVVEEVLDFQADL